jgi:NCAIR mutase (PurE)-related protein
MAEGKDPAMVLEIVRAMLEHNGVAILSRVRPRVARALTQSCADEAILDYPRSRMLVIRRPDSPRPETGGKVGVITAGTSDVPVAEQVQVMASEMGCRVFPVYDVGVAGIHRLVGPLRGLFEAEVDVIVVVAGMDGALPSVVAGLVDVPVIGVPTSTGYGLGGKGLAALLSILQTCAPGLVAVNIDNGVGAGTTAALIANRVATARRANRGETSSTDAA